MSAPPGSAAAVSDQLSLGTSQNHQGPGTGFLTSMKPPGTNQGVRAHVPVFVDRLHRFPQTLTSSYPWREPAGRPPAVLSGTPFPQTTARYSRQVWGVMVIAPHSTHLDSCVTSSILALQPAFIWASSVQRQMPGLQGRVQKAGTAGLLSASRQMTLTDKSKRREGPLPAGVTWQAPGRVFEISQTPEITSFGIER